MGSSLIPVYSGFSQSELDREYSPSSCVDDINVYLENYARASRKAKESALNQNSSLSNLSYGPSPDERLDLFLPAATGQAPLLVFIHGGYWQALSKEDSLFAATQFQETGAFFAALDYSLAPSASLTQIVTQVRDAVCWLYREADCLGFDPDRIYLTGSSAGAHLAVMMLTIDWPAFGLPRHVIKGVSAVSGIYDLEPIRLSYVNDLLGLDAQEATANSPIHQVIRNHCPLILAYGDNETREFKRQTDDFREKLLESELSVSFKEIRDRNHFDAIMDLGESDTWLAKQVLRQMER